MDRRAFLQSTLLSSATLVLPACTRLGGTAAPRGQVMTVRGPIEADALGLTLPHEHLFADLRPYEEQARTPYSPDADEVVAVVLPHLERIRELGCQSLVDCTPMHLGRHPAIIQRLSDASGLHLLMATGNYAAAGARFVPPYVMSEPSDALAERWIGEWERGINGTDVRPGLVKIGVDGGTLTATEEKLVQAAIQTHLETGLVIGTHIGPWGEVEPGHNATSAFAQLTLLEEAGVDASAWIWIHAQNEEEAAQPVRAAQRGAWVSFDGFRPERVEHYVSLITRMRDEGLLHRLLISQDAGWYSAGEEGGGDFTPFYPLFTSLMPALRENGFTDDEVDTLFVSNPARAFSVRVRRVRG